MRLVVPPGAAQTEALQKAIDDCYLSGGGEVCLAAGEHHTGGLRLRSRVTLHLLSGAKLIGSRDPEDYFAYRRDAIEPLEKEEISDIPWSRQSADQDPSCSILRIPGSRWNNALIRLLHARDAAIVGDEGSVIDGMDPYDEAGEENYRGPHGIDAHDCENIRFSGYTIQNTGNWAHAVFHSRNLVFENITVLAGHDGIHVTSCANIQIDRCNFYTGDDCIAGFANQNVTVQGCEINTACSAFRFGGTNVFVEDCHIFGPARHVFRGSLTKEEKIAGAHPAKDGKHRFNMLSVFTYYADFSFPIPLEPRNIVFSRCRVENADRFLHFNYSGNELWQKNRPLSEICFQKIDAQGITMPLTAYGDEQNPVRIAIRDSRIAFAPEADVPLMHLANCERVELVNLTILRNGASPWILAWGDAVTLETKNIHGPGVERLCITKAQEPFSCRAI